MNQERGVNILERWKVRWQGHYRRIGRIQKGQGRILDSGRIGSDVIKGLK